MLTLPFALLLACAAPSAPSIAGPAREEEPARQEPARAEPKPAEGWQHLEPGLDFATFEAPNRSELGDSLLRVLRVDPRVRELVLVGGFTTPAPPGPPMTSSRTPGSCCQSW